ncbi:TPA: hypothetical protein ACLA03_002088, partial [Neisseria meningitidis]
FLLIHYKVPRVFFYGVLKSRDCIRAAAHRPARGLRLNCVVETQRFLKKISYCFISKYNHF